MRRMVSVFVLVVAWTLWPESVCPDDNGDVAGVGRGCYCLVERHIIE